MYNNPFILPLNNYKRDIDVFKHYVKDSATYISLMTGKDYIDCVSFVIKETGSNGKFQFKDPKVDCLIRDNNDDRLRVETTLMEYLGSSIKDKELIAPTFTTYINPDVKESLIVPFVEANIKGRSIAKKEMFVAKANGDEVLVKIKDIEQKNKKLYNNAISGAHCSAGTPFYNKTSHSTLTSNCRSTSAYGNSNNEKLLCGNRHYWAPNILINNIISIINNTDLNLFQSILDKYELRYPTIEETINCYKYSTDLYWHGIKDHEQIALLVSKLSDIQRAAFVYTGDLYHLKKYNEVAIRKFIGKLSARGKSTDIKDLDIYSKSHESIVNLAAQICSDILKGKKVSNIKGTNDYLIYISTIENIYNTLTEYESFINVFFTNNNVPSSMAVFPSSIRRCAVTSDTDSTIFTVQDWVVWFFNKMSFDTEATAVGATMIFIASESITHILAKMSANFGIREDRIDKIAMKNEFYFPIFTPTDVTKHYYALRSYQEGIVFENNETEIKGVHLKASNAPKIIIKDAEKMMLYILNTVADNKKISIKYILKWIADREREIESTIRKGGHDYFKLQQVKAIDSYKKGNEASTYQQYMLWEKVFAPKYGSAPNPPYTAIKVNMDINSPMATKEWLERIVDREIADKLAEWLQNKDSKAFGGTFILPEQLVSARGIPEEIVMAIDIRKLIFDASGIYYLILETLGVYLINKKHSIMAYDLY